MWENRDKILHHLKKMAQKEGKVISEMIEEWAKAPS
jgi:hypothetical protein